MSALVKWTPAAGELIALPGGTVHGLDLSTVEGKRVAYRCRINADKLLSDMVGKTIDVANFFMHHVERFDEETGESRPGPRCVFILSNDTRIVTSIEGAIKCLLAWASLNEVSPPWKPALKFKVCQESSKRGPGKYLYLDLV